MRARIVREEVLRGVALIAEGHVLLGVAGALARDGEEYRHLPTPKLDADLGPVRAREGLATPQRRRRRRARGQLALLLRNAKPAPTSSVRLLFFVLV